MKPDILGHRTFIHFVSGVLRIESFLSCCVVDWETRIQVFISRRIMVTAFNGSLLNLCYSNRSKWKFYYDLSLCSVEMLSHYVSAKIILLLKTFSLINNINSTLY